MHSNDRIMAVDDSTDNLLVLQELLAQDYTFMGLNSGAEALRIAPSFVPDLILLDVMMPPPDGIQTCRLLQSLPELKGSRVVMLSAKSRLPDRMAAYDAGAVDYISKPFDHAEVLSKVRAWMRMTGHELVEDIRRTVDAAQAVVGAAMLSLASYRDTETGEHLFRVRWYAQALAEELSAHGPYRAIVDNEFLECLYRASPLHDIGKIAIDDAILRKPGSLTSEEFNRMQAHTVIGAEILRAASRKLPGAKYLEMAADIARHHHERFDGTGYPDGLRGDAIPLAARILSVVDVFDALTTDRVYRKALPVGEAIRILQEGSDAQFDPAVIDSFSAQLGLFRQAQVRFASRCAMYDSSLASGKPNAASMKSASWFLDRFGNPTASSSNGAPARI